MLLELIARVAEYRTSNTGLSRAMDRLIVVDFYRLSVEVVPLPLKYLSKANE